MYLEDVQKSRQLMLKSSGRPVKDQKESSCTDQRSVNLLNSLENQHCPTLFVANNSNNGNPIIAVFPRINGPAPEEEKDNNN